MNHQTSETLTQNKQLSGVVFIIFITTPFPVNCAQSQQTSPNVHCKAVLYARTYGGHGDLRRNCGIKSVLDSVLCTQLRIKIMMR